MATQEKLTVGMIAGGTGATRGAKIEATVKIWGKCTVKGRHAEKPFTCAACGGTGGSEDEPTCYVILDEQGVEHKMGFGCLARLHALKQLILPKPAATS